MIRYRGFGLCLSAGLLLLAGSAWVGCSDDDGGGEGCGDGNPQLPEMCDDGNSQAGDGCSADCQVEHGYVCWDTPSVCRTSCGDGIVSGDEECDDGNHVFMDGCTADCLVEFGFDCSGEPSGCVEICGDGQVVGGEECDDGDTADGDGCSASCTVENGYECTGVPSDCIGICGNGWMTPDEECDDGNTGADDGCAADCSVEDGWDCTGEPSSCVTICGDGIVTGGEPCDDAGESASCDDDCTPAVCGDGNPNPTSGEDCDEAGEAAACDADCTIPECGDSDVNLASGEGCDDGATAAGDGCNATCGVEPGYYCSGEPSVCTTSCGDGTVAGNEDCDDAGESAACDVNCTFSSCGDGTVNGSAGEACDDGNLDDGDGCTSGCLVQHGYACVGEPSSCYVDCGDGIVYGTEECDDAGETVGCDANCTWASCGDGDLNTTAGETCDDGNNTSGDGCDATCHIEFVCGDAMCDVANGETCQACPGDCCPSCGNNIREPGQGEQCDGADFDGQTCADFCYPGGTLSCTSYCTVDTSTCTGALPTCGDGVVDCGEQCDSANLGGADCYSVGRDGGTLACDGSCGFDVSGCGALLWYLWDDFEDPTTLAAWTLGGDWAAGTPSYTGEPNAPHSGLNVIGTVIGGNYTNSNSYTVDRAETPPINLATATSPVLRFYMWVNTEAGWDCGALFIDSGAGFQHVTNASVAYNGNEGGYSCWEGTLVSSWQEVTVDLTAYVGQTIRIGFGFYSDSIIAYAGWYIDDVIVAEPGALP